MSGCGDGSVVEGSAAELFQLAALLMGSQADAVALVEETLASVEIDPCLDPAAARRLTSQKVLALGLGRLRRTDPSSFTGVPVGGNPVCVEDEDLSVAGISHGQLTEWLASEGRQDLRGWLAALPGAQRAIFVQRAVLRQGNAAVATALEASATGEAGTGAKWSSESVGEVYRLALCSLANSLAHSPAATPQMSLHGAELGR